jgi:hypothetical protein
MGAQQTRRFAVDSRPHAEGVVPILNAASLNAVMVGVLHVQRTAMILRHLALTVLTLHIMGGANPLVRFVMGNAAWLAQAIQIVHSENALSSERLTRQCVVLQMRAFVKVEDSFLMLLEERVVPAKIITNAPAIRHVDPQAR